MTSVPTVDLTNGVAMPRLGYGGFQVPEAETTAAVTAALEAGYRSIDTADGNEGGGGRALAESGLPRDDLFVTTKLWNADQGYHKTLRAFDDSLRLLELEHLDLVPDPLARPRTRPLPRELARARSAPRGRQGAGHRCLPLPASAPAPPRRDQRNHAHDQ